MDLLSSSSAGELHALPASEFLTASWGLLRCSGSPPGSLGLIMELAKRGSLGDNLCDFHAYRMTLPVGRSLGGMDSGSTHPATQAASQPAESETIAKVAA